MTSIQQNLNKIIRAWPLLACCMVITVAIGWTYLRYATPKYQALCRIKLENPQTGVFSTSLYKELDIFSDKSNTASEVELIKSNLILSKAIEKVNFATRYFRVGEVKTTEIYDECPFEVTYKVTNPGFYGKPIEVVLSADSVLTVKLGETKQFLNFGETFEKEGITINFEFREGFSKKAFADHFQVKIFSHEEIINKEIKPNLVVFESEDEIPIINILYKNEVAPKCKDFCEALAQAYLEDYISNRSYIAGSTVRFIEKQLKQVKVKLIKSENALEQYRLDRRIINLRQESETGIRRISELKTQLSQLEMQEESVEELKRFLDESSDDAFLSLSPRFGAFGDLSFVEILKKLKRFQEERAILVDKYTDNHELVQQVNGQIKHLLSFLREGVTNTRQDLLLRKQKLTEEVEMATAEFDDFPTREKEYQILQREFETAQSLYNYLGEKRTEAAIREASNKSFHRIIDAPELPTEPSSPNRILILMVSVMLGFFIGLFFQFIKQTFFATIEDEEDLEVPSDKLGLRQTEKLEVLTVSYLLNNQKGGIICLAYQPGADISAFSHKVKHSFLAKGLSIRHKTYSDFFSDMQQGQPYNDFDSKIADMLGERDLLMVEMPMMNNDLNVIYALKQANQRLFLFNEGSTSKKQINEVNTWVDRFQLGSYQAVILEKEALSMAEATVNVKGFLTKKRSWAWTS